MEENMLKGSECGVYGRQKKLKAKEYKIQKNRPKLGV